MTRYKAIAVWIATAIALPASALAAAPSIAEKTGVRTLASVENRSILARGSAFEVTGSDLGPPEETAVAEIPYNTEFAGVTVRLTSTKDAGITADAFVLSASATRITAIIPSTTAAGEYSVTTTYAGESSSNSFKVKIADSGFGMLTNTGTTGGLVQGRILAEGADPSRITFANPIPSGGASLQLDATGLGPIDSADNELPAENNLYPEASLMIGDLEIPITYLGRNPQRPGYDLILVTLPPDTLPAGCMVPARLHFGEFTSLPFSLPILGAGETGCKHPLGLSPEGLETVLNGGSIVRGGFTLTRVYGESSAGGRTFRSEGDQLSGGFLQLTPEDLARMAAAAAVVNVYDADGCTVYDSMNGDSPTVFVDAGPRLTLVDPSWNIAVPRGTGQSLNQYNISLNTLLDGAPIPGLVSPRLRFGPGPHNISGPGGAVVGPFSVDLEVSPEMVWSNMSDVKEVDTSKELVLTFTGAAPDDTVIGTQLVEGPAPEDPSKIVSRVWLCQVKGSAGRIVAKPGVLQRMPRVSAAELANPRSGRYSSLTVGSYNPEGAGIFRAPLVNGGQTEPAAFIFNYTWAKTPVPVR
jgi:uncharacterized protein (TIGR03437 family)